MNLLFTTAVLAGLEKLINAALRYDPGTRAQLAASSGRVLAIHITTPDVRCYFLPAEDGLQCCAQWEGEVDTQLRGSLPALLKLLQSQGTRFAGSGVEIAGDTALLAELQRLLQNLDIDWEDALSEVVGDVTAHQSAQWIRKGADYTHARAQEINRLLGEFLTEELRAVVARNELENFYQEVDEVRLSLDRLEVRVQRLLNGHSASNQG